MTLKPDAPSALNRTKPKGIPNMDINPKTLKPRLDAARRAMGKIIVANPHPIALSFASLIIGRPVIATSLRGRGKTALAMAFENMLHDSSFIRIQCTPQMMPSDITGEKLYDEELKKYVVKPSKAIGATVVLVDEVNRAGEETQAAFMELCENQGVTLDGVFYPLPQPNLWIFTRNPDGQVGTYRLADPMRDRLALDFDMSFPPRDDMEVLVRSTDIHRGIFNMTPMMDKDEILQIRDFVNHMVANVPKAVYNYTYDLMEAMQIDLPAFGKLDLAPTGKKRKLDFGQMQLSAKALKELPTKAGTELPISNVQELELLEDGISPRAFIWLMHSAAAMAFMEGSDEIGFQHIQQVWIPSARHKLIMRPVARSLGIKPEHILTAVLNSVEF